ncbi:MAG TPA: IS3 family transposase [Sphingobacteriaceae bacterium]|nr:IS3 family transposase [Sphingobacteriaceae bacterium]
MKTEMEHHQKNHYQRTSKLAVFEYVKIWYNRDRKHSSLGYLTTYKYEKLVMNNELAA